MALIKQCDVCEKRYETDSMEVVMDRPVRGFILITDFQHSSKRVDLCPECAKSFKAWFESRCAN